jgi:predicted alpha/beta-fold hydrolase
MAGEIRRETKAPMSSAGANRIMQLASAENDYGLGDSQLLIPPFEPHPWLRGGHSQTIVGRYLGGARKQLAGVPREVALADGDRLVIRESVPPGWEPPRATALLVHGLAGSADASYVVRVGRRLSALGVRVVRVNLRGAGEGFGLARGIYHAGRSDDVREVVNDLEARTPGSPIALIGFSLGANLVLKLAAEAASAPLPILDCVLAANPPIDLAGCAQMMLRGENRLYDWNFVRWLRATVIQLHNRFPDLGPPRLEGVRTLYDFDDQYTAPRNGFGTADVYYERCSLMNALAQIQVPGLIVHAMDDPFVSQEPLRIARRPAHLDVELLRHGGHLGYLSRHPWYGDRRWLDARLTVWLKSHWGGMNAG